MWLGFSLPILRRRFLQSAVAKKTPASWVSREIITLHTVRTKLSQNPLCHRWRNGVSVGGILIDNRQGHAVIVGEPLDTGVLDVGQTAITAPYLVPFIVTTCRGSERRGDSVHAEDRVAHAGSAHLIAEYLHTAAKAIHGLVSRKPLMCGFGEVEVVRHLWLEHACQRHSG